MTVYLHRVYDDHQYSGSVRQDDATHGAFLARPHRRPRTFHGHRRVARVPLHVSHCFWTGFAYGAFQSYAQACYAELIPKGEEVWRYALFSVMDKVTCRSTAQADHHADVFLSAVELIFGLISDATGSICYTFFLLMIMVRLAVPILLSVNVDQGGTDARNYHAEGHVVNLTGFDGGIICTSGFVLDLIIYIFCYHR